MPLSVSLKLSADGGNQLSFGPDNGLHVATQAVRGGPYGYTLDNSLHTAAAAATYYYAMPWSSVTGYPLTANTAQLAPFIVTRDCRITEAALSVTVAGTGSQVFQSLYAADAAGWPGVKVVDLWSAVTNVAGMRQATMLNPSTVLTGGKLYWTATWAYTTSAYPSVSCRNGNALFYSQRLGDRPTVTNYFGTGVLSLTDTAQSWSSLTVAPAALTPTSPVGGTAPSNLFTTSPFVWYGLYNV